MKINLSSNIPSKFGVFYLAQLASVGIHNFKTLQKAYQQENKIIDKATYREFWLEIFRKDCPELKGLSLKSRLNSFFATETIEESYKFIERNEIKSPVRIFEVHSHDTGLKLDMTWLDYKFPRNYRAFQYYYTQYWKGIKIEDDEYLKEDEKRGSLIEVLLNQDVVIGKVVETYNCKKSKIIVNL